MGSFCLTVNSLVVLHMKIQVCCVLHRNMEVFEEEVASVEASCLGQAPLVCVPMCLGFFVFVGVSWLPVFRYHLAEWVPVL